MLDSETLHDQYYWKRRKVLEDIIIVKPGWAMLSERIRIDVRGLRLSLAAGKLRNIVAEHIADYEEGVVLKAENSQYRHAHLPWVKIKKDYIAGYGDCIDLVVVGAGWNKERGRELRGMYLIS